ncbi:MAG: S8 family peptidase [Ectobacillus sp.]
MRKNLTIGILILLATSVLIMVFLPDRQANKQSQPNNAYKISKVPMRAEHFHRSPQLLRIDFSSMNDTVKQQVESKASVKIIRHNKQDRSHYTAKEVVVDFKIRPTDTEIAGMLQEIDGQIIRTFNTSYIIKSKSKSAEELVRYFTNKPNVEFAERNYILMQNEVNDVFYNTYQWNLPAISTELGWDITRGAKDVEIAVIDSGIDLNHPELSHRLIKGYNILAENGQPNDDNGHGTHVAGIIASETNNGEGIAGITWYNPIMPIKALNAEGYGNSFDVAKGIVWAADNGADVINLSLGNYQPSAVLEQAVNYALQKNIVLVAAAGNDNTGQPSFPAALPGVIGVAAVGGDGSRAQFSNFGDHIDVAAPGVDIPSTYIGGRYAALSGTSMAAPHVSALAALIRSLNPDMKNTEVADIIMKTAKETGPAGRDVYYGNGIIDIVKALRLASGQGK